MTGAVNTPLTLGPDLFNLRALRGYPLLAQDELRRVLEGSLHLSSDHPELQLLIQLRWPHRLLALAYAPAPWLPLSRADDIGAEHYPQLARLEAINRLVSADLHGVEHLRASGVKPKQALERLASLHALQTLNVPLLDLDGLQKTLRRHWLMLRPLLASEDALHMLRSLSPGQDDGPARRWSIPAWLGLLRLQVRASGEWTRDPHVMTGRLIPSEALTDDLKQWEQATGQRGFPNRSLSGTHWFERAPLEGENLARLIRLLETLGTARAPSAPSRPGLGRAESQLLSLQLPPMDAAEDSLTHELLTLATLLGAPEVSPAFRDASFRAGRSSFVRGVRWLAEELTPHAPAMQARLRLVTRGLKPEEPQ